MVMQYLFYLDTERSLILKTEKQIRSLATQDEAVETRKELPRPVSTTKKDIER